MRVLVAIFFIVLIGDCVASSLPKLGESQDFDFVEEESFWGLRGLQGSMSLPDGPLDPQRPSPTVAPPTGQPPTSALQPSPRPPSLRPPSMSPPDPQPAPTMRDLPLECLGTCKASGELCFFGDRCCCNPAGCNLAGVSGVGSCA